MHIEDRVMPCNGPKSIFPLPLNGQTLMFSATTGNTNRCNHGRGNMHALPHSLEHTRCSCESNSLTGYNRVLLPATSNEQIRLAATRANYESLILNGFPLYGKFGADSYPSLDYALLANARRKNATRETTSTLKAWLNEHKKNPYPTKGEKIMLAILTKMTLTQVSTWFANARRRLKKENKMTWSPRKKSGEKKNNDGDDESCLSDSDVEGMDVDVVEMEKEPIIKCTTDEPATSSESGIQRPSVIRTLESPTFNEIRDRFKDEISPVKNLEKWVNGCIKSSPDDQAEFPDELTPPSTPIENKTTTFSSQTLFEAFDAAKNNGKAADVSKPLSVESSYTKEPLHLIFSSKQPVCSPKEVTTQNATNQATKASEVPAGIITPQPSPKNDTQFLLKEAEREDQPEVRVQGLTTSRELEAVLALTNLCKT